MDIDFIKWMIKKAGWKWIPPFESETVSMTISSIQIDQYDTLVFITDDFNKSVWFHILLQRAIEGINRECPNGGLYWIEQGMNYLEAIDNNCDYEQFDIDKYDFSFDQTKEATLEYIYEQEKR